VADGATTTAEPVGLSAASVSLPYNRFEEIQMRFPSIKLAASALLAVSAAGASLPAAAAPRIGFWAGETVTTCNSTDPVTCPRDVSNYSTALWDKLKANNSFVYMDLVYGSDFGPTLAGSNARTDGLQLVQQANAKGVSISAWITVPLAYGTFANEENAAIIRQAVEAFVAWKAQNNLQFEQAILDLEFPLGTQAINQALQGNLTPVQNLMALNINPAGQCTAMAAFRDTISWAHQQGLKLSGSPIPFTVEDIPNGNMALQDAMNMVAFPPFGYDALYLQAYRAVGPDLGSGYVASLYATMQQRFGAKGQVTIGNTGYPPYDQVANIVADVRMLAAMGATTIPLFSLDSAVETYGLTGIQQIFNAAYNPMNWMELASATQMTPTGQAARDLFVYLDNFATALTPVATAIAGNPQSPNSYPNGCGNMNAVPLVP